MPIYDYKCTQCSSNIEYKRDFGDSTEPVCCNETMQRQWQSPGVVFNGSGFYSTDNRKRQYTMSTMIEQEEQVWLLDATDRCDSCAAQAYVQVIGHVGELLFCNHHYNKIMDNAVGYDKMMKFIVEIIDERQRLQQGW